MVKGGGSQPFWLAVHFASETPDGTHLEVLNLIFMVKFAQNWLNLNQQIFKMVKNCSFGFQDIFFLTVSF